MNEASKSEQAFLADAREKIALLLESGPQLYGSDLEARTMRGAVSGWTQAIGRVLVILGESDDTPDRPEVDKHE
jgi:hypothetical protein